MPRKKAVEKFKYTVRKKDRNGNSVLYVVYPIPGEKYPVWRKPAEETQEAVSQTIEEIKKAHAVLRQAGRVPRRCSEFFDFWLNLIQTTVSLRTYDDRQSKIEKYLRPEFGIKEMDEIKPVMLQMLYSRLAKTLMPNTVRKLHSIARLIFKEAVNLEIIASSPVERVKPPKVVETGKVKFMSLLEAKSFLKAAKDSKHGIIFEFALETAMRPQEYLGLRWSDVDLKKGIVEITRAVVFHKKGGGFYYKDTKTRGSRRTISLSKSLCEKLEHHRDAQNEYLREIESRLKKRYKPSLQFQREFNRTILENHAAQNLIFASDDGTPINNINLGVRYFKPIAEAAGLSSDLSLYSLRHSSISLLLAAGVNIKVVAERAGHRNIALTLQVYSHVLPGMGRDATEKLTELLNRED